MKWVILSLPSLCWFSFYNWQTVKAVTLTFYINQQHFIRDIRTKFGIPNLPQSPDIGQTSYGSISYSQIYGKSLIKENFHNSRTNHDINMKLEPVTKLDKRNKTTQKNLMITPCWQIKTWLSFFWFMANLW